MGLPGGGQPKQAHAGGAAGQTGDAPTGAVAASPNLVVIPPGAHGGAPPSLRGQPQLLEKLSGSATTVTPRWVAPTRTIWPLGRMVARTGPMMGSLMGTAAIRR